MAFQMRNFVIDRIRRGFMTHSSTGEVLWCLNQIENPTLNVTAETADAVDALGTPIASFNRAKQAEFSAESSLFDLGLLAAQSGTAISDASTSNKYAVPCPEELTVSAADTLTLARTPIDGSLKFVYVLNGDGSLGTRYTIGESAGEDTVSVAGKVITFAEGKAPVGSRWFAFYEYEASDEAGYGASQVVNTAIDFPTAGRFVMEVLGADVCDPSTLYYAIVEFPNAKMMSDFDLSFTTDSKHPFTLRAMQEYCDAEKILFRIIIPENAIAV